MPLFRKKPVVIEARQVTCIISELQEIADWCGGEYSPDVPDDDGHDVDARIYIETIEGEMGAKPSDWIIKGVANEFYPCKPDIFEKTYEQVERSPSGTRIKYVNG